MQTILVQKRELLDTRRAALQEAMGAAEPNLETIRSLTAEVESLGNDVRTLAQAHDALERDQHDRGQRSVPGAVVAVPGRPNVATVTVENRHVVSHEGEGDLDDEQIAYLGTREYLSGLRDFVRGRNVSTRALEGGIDPQGGFLIPPQYINQIIQRRPAPTRVASRVRRLNASGNSVMLPRVTGGDDTYSSNVRIQWTGENKPAGNYTPTAAQEAQFGLSTINIHEGLITGQISRTLLEDAAFDVLGWITEEVVRAKQLEDDRVILVGDGIGKPVGITNSTNPLATVTSIANDAISADDIRLLPFALPEQYVENAVWVMNRANTGRAIAGLKDAENRYLFGQGLQDSGLAVRVGTNLCGYDVLYSTFMPNVADGAIPVLFGDLSSYYMVDRIAMSVQILNETAAKQGAVEFVVRYRTGGDYMEQWGMRGLLIQ